MSQTFGFFSLEDSSQIFCGTGERFFKDMKNVTREELCVSSKNSSSKIKQGNSPNPLLHTGDAVKQ